MLIAEVYIDVTTESFDQVFGLIVLIPILSSATLLPLAHFDNFSSMLIIAHNLLYRFRSHV